MKLFRFLFLSLLLTWSANAFADANIVSSERTKASLISEVQAVPAGKKFWVALHIKLNPGWHTYWKNPGDSGIPPKLEWTLPKGFTADEVKYLAPERKKVGPLVDYAYSDDAYYLVQITPAETLQENATLIFQLKAKWLVCNEICVPEQADLSLILHASTPSLPAPAANAEGELVAELVTQLPVPASRTFGYLVQEPNVQFAMPLKGDAFKEIKSAEYFPLTDGFISNAAPQKTNITPQNLLFTIPHAEGKIPQTADGLISVHLNGGERKDYEVHLQQGLLAPEAGTDLIETTHDGNPVQTAIILALLGGLVLNLMPCVFPVLSLKCLAVAKKSAAHPRVVRLQGLAYATGVILSFLAMAGILITVQASGEVVGWGYQMQSPVFVAALSILLLIVGFNLSGFFELPVFLGNFGNDTASEDNLWGSFATGALAVLVATPCTAPFMAPAIGFALTQNIATTLAIFAALGVGLSLPFLLLSLFPGLVRLLPKPGPWMQTFKELLSFPVYISVVWLLWVLTREAGPDALAITLLGMICFAFSLWLWTSDSSGVRFAGLAVVVIGLTICLNLIHVIPLSSGGPTLQSHAERYSPSRLKILRQDGKAVFVDATADWCITCKVNETVVLSSKEVVDAFTDKSITYMVADWTHGDPEITKFLSSFGRSGVPIYVYYPPDDGKPIVLPQILTPGIVLETIK